MTDQLIRVTPSWLSLRERADADARTGDFLPLIGSGRIDATMVIHDLGCGTGSMGRWLAPRLAGSQHWIMHDRDGDLLERAGAGMVEWAADGAAVTVETRRCDVGRLTAVDLAGAGLVTASALLDLLSADEVDRIAAACAGAGCPALLTLSVLGQVELTPADPLDGEITAAFNAHQRRRVGDRQLLGPDAVDAAVDSFGRHGLTTAVRPSPWRLGPDDADLITEWFAGWLDAAVEQRPDLAGPVEAYRVRRLAQVGDGRLGVVVQHGDVYAGPAPGGSGG